MIEKVVEEFKKRFGADGDIRSYFAPGRVNLIGEHTDYNGGHVFPCALSMGNYAVARKRDDRKVRWFNMTYPADGVKEFDIDSFAPNDNGIWYDYQAGVIWALKETGHEIPCGYDMVMLSDMPAGSGLSASASIEEIHDGVVERRKFPDDVVDELHPGSTVTTELEYNLAWARTYLRKNGLILRSKNGVWALTKLGVEASKKDSIDRKAIVKGAVAAQKNEAAENPLEIEERRPWRDSLSEILHNMNPFAFEVLAQRLLRECGFLDVHVTKKSGDGGIDGTGKLRLNGIFSFNVAFQCKRYKGQVGAGEIRDFRGSLDNNIEKGVLITTGSFSKAAREEACAPGKKQIDLMDGNDFMDKLAEYSIGLTPRVEYDIDEEFFAAINDTQENI